jgi:hypothetical protein
MIKARFLFKDSDYSGLEVSGHAFFDEHGKDIVCAGVSALATTGYNSLSFHIGEEKIRLEIDESKGYLKFEIIDGNKEDYEKSNLILKTIEIGIDSIAQAYAGHVTVKKGGGWHAKN